MTTQDDELIATTRHALKHVWDPELGVDVVSLGLIYDIRVVDGGIEVDMTLTTPGCPVSEQLSGEAARAVREAVPGTPVEVNVVWEPPWTPDRMAPDAVSNLFSR